MTHTQAAANPFTLMLDPESIFRAIEASERLARLQSHICRPLDKPLIPKVDAAEDGESSIEAESESDAE